MSDQRARVQTQFGAAAQAYVAAPDFSRGNDLDHFRAWGASPRPDRVLDVATGGGHTALAFAGIARSVTALDVTEPMLRAAARHLGEQGATNVGFVVGEAERLPFGTGAFDLVTCRIAPHHFLAVTEAVQEIARVLRPGGTLVLEDILGHDDPAAAAFITEVERRRDPSHVRAYRSDEWAGYLQAARLTLTDRLTLRRVREWDEWTRMMRMPPAAKAALERFVLDTPAAVRAAFDFQFHDGTIRAFSDTMILFRARKP